jgi:hypothetical protein
MYDMGDNRVADHEKRKRAVEKKQKTYDSCTNDPRIVALRDMLMPQIVKAFEEGADEIKFFGSEVWPYFASDTSILEKWMNMFQINAKIENQISEIKISFYYY